MLFLKLIVMLSLNLNLFFVRLMQHLFPTNGSNYLDWDSGFTFKKVNELYKETGGCDTILQRIDANLVDAMKLRNIHVKMSENEMIDSIKTVVKRFYDFKSDIDQLNQFFSSGLSGVLDEEHWDQDISNLYNRLNMTQRLFHDDLSHVLSKSSLDLGGEYQEFVSDIVSESDSEIFKQLWKDVVSAQLNKYNQTGIKVQDMDCIDVCLFVKSLMNEQSRNNQSSDSDNMLGVDKFIFENKINGRTLFQYRNSLTVRLGQTSPNTKFKWNGRLSMKLLNLMYKYVAKPKWEKLKREINNGMVPMKDVEHFIQECVFTTSEKLREELSKLNMAHVVSNIVKAMKCGRMLHDELLAVNLLHILHHILNKEDNEKIEHLKSDNDFNKLLEQVYESKYPWNNDDDMANRGREALNGLFSPITDKSSQPATLNDIVAIWTKKDHVFFYKIDKKKTKSNKQKQNAIRTATMTTAMATTNNDNNNVTILNKTSTKWLELCVTNEKVIEELFDRFGNDDVFEQHKALSQYSDPMSETRKNILDQVRDYFVKRIAHHIIFNSMTMSEARLFLVNRVFSNVKNNNVQQLKNLIRIWDEIARRDFRQNQFGQDRTIFSRLSHFVIKNCRLEVTTRKRNESGVVAVDSKQNEAHKHRHGIDKNGFTNLMDRLLININSDTQGQTKLEMKENFKEWTTSQVCNVIKRRRYKSGEVLINIFETRGINGKLLFKYHESQEFMMYLLFSKIEGMEERKASDIGETFLDFDLRKLENITTRHAIEYDYSEIKIDNDNNNDNDDSDDTTTLENKGKDIANDVLRAVQLNLLRQQMNLVIPKFEMMKKSLRIMTEYETMGGRADLLNKEIKIDVYDPSINKCKILLETWEKELKEWTTMMNDLRSRYKFLCYFTVSEMRFICNEWCKYYDKCISKQEKDKCVWRLNGKFCIVNPLLGFEEIREFLEKYKLFGKNNESGGNGDERLLFEELGQHFESFFGDGVIMATERKQQENQEQQDFVKRGEASVFHCSNEDKILDYIIKLYSTQGYLPQPSNVLFCTPNTRSEEVLCFLRRSCNNNNTLHCLVAPEKLGSRVCDDLLAVLANYIYENDALFCVIIHDNTSKIYGYLSMYDARVSLILEDLLKEEFYQECIVTDDTRNASATGFGHGHRNKQFLSFLKSSVSTSTSLPFVRVYVSDDASVGKTYEIRKLAKETNVRLIHIPCNTFNCDEEFIINRLCSVYENCNVNDNDNNNDNEKVIFHFNISSYCSKDINVLLFKLLVLKHLSCYDENGKKGKSFCVTSNHAFFIELPCQLSHEFKHTKLRTVLNHFYFIKDDSCVSHVKITNDLNRFKPNGKHIFVLKYLDALSKGLLEIKGKKFIDQDWDWKKHDIGDIANNPQQIKSLVP